MTADVYMPCPADDCDLQVWVSPEDEDASFSDLWGHVVSRHTYGDRDTTHRLMYQVRLIDADGNPVKEDQR